MKHQVYWLCEQKIEAELQKKKDISACTFFPSLLAGKLATFKHLLLTETIKKLAHAFYMRIKAGKIYIVRAIHFKIAKQHWLTFFLRFAYVLICDLIQQILEENVIVWMNLVFTCLLLSCSIPGLHFPISVQENENKR